jgi:queuine/archaeosine tRNA-ribosyltransferase
MSFSTDDDSKMAFTIGATEGAARVGTLLTRQGAIRTPTALIYTRRGGCMYLTPDMMEKLRPAAQGVQINAMQLCVRICICVVFWAV